MRHTNNNNFHNGNRHFRTNQESYNRISNSQIIKTIQNGELPNDQILHNLETIIEMGRQVNYENAQWRGDMQEIWLHSRVNNSNGNSNKDIIRALELTDNLHLSLILSGPLLAQALKIDNIVNIQFTGGLHSNKVRITLANSVKPHSSHISHNYNQRRPRNENIKDQTPIAEVKKEAARIAQLPSDDVITVSKEELQVMIKQMITETSSTSTAEHIADSKVELKIIESKVELKTDEPKIIESKIELKTDEPKIIESKNTEQKINELNVLPLPVIIPITKPLEEKRRWSDDCP
jgi:hypothetical protein